MAPTNNATPPSAADHDIAAAARYSRYLERLLAADPAVLTASELERAYSTAEMRSGLAAGGITDNRTLDRALRRLRQRVMARLIARDLSGRAALDEVVTTVTELAEIAVRTAVSRLHADLATVQERQSARLTL